jgi:hypothetical protein
MSEFGEYKSLSEWCRDEGANYPTMVKRRREANAGFALNARLWLLNEMDWDMVKKTPLPGCRRVR